MRLEMTPHQSYVVLARFMREGKLKESVVRAALKDEVTQLHERLTLLEGAARKRRKQVGVRPHRVVVSRPVSTNGRHKKNPKRVLQGRYMGMVRPLSIANRKAVKKVREEKGVNAAIREAKRLAVAVAK